MSRESVFQEISAERERQIKKWGPQHHPDVHPSAKAGTEFDACFFACLPSEEEIKKEVDEQAAEHDENWAGIATEELVESVNATTVEARRVELVQAAAVLVAWIEDIDSREVQ